MKFLTEYQSVVGDLRWGPTSVLIYTRGTIKLKGADDMEVWHVLGRKADPRAAVESTG